MTIDPKTVERIRGLKDEGYSDRRIAKQLHISLNSIIKYKHGNHKEELINDDEKNTRREQLNDEFEMAQGRRILQDRIIKMIDVLQDIDSQDAQSLIEDVGFLQQTLEDAFDFETIGWIQGKYNEIEEKRVQICNQLAEQAQQEERKAKEKYDRLYSRLNEQLLETLETMNIVLSREWTSNDIQKIIKASLPYGEDIHYLASCGRLVQILENYGVSEEKARSTARICMGRFYHN